MREVDLRRVDLNLLVALDVLLEEKSVTRAAQRLGLSQPATSRALARLRTLFSDALLVEARGGYILSARAESIRSALRRTLAGVSEMLEASPFDPTTARGHVRLLMPDLPAAALAPTSLFEALEDDAVDAIVGVVDEAPAGIRRRGLSG